MPSQFYKKWISKFVEYIPKLGFHSGKQKFPEDYKPEIITNTVNFELTSRLRRMSSQMNTSQTAGILARSSQLPPYIYLRTPFFFQESPNECVDACVLMVICFHMRFVSPTNVIPHTNKGAILSRVPPELQTLMEQSRRIFLGSGLDAIMLERGELREIKLQLPLSSQWIASLLYLHGPLGISLWPTRFIGHAMVIVGVFNDTVILHDPWYGPDQHWSIQRLERIMTARPEDIFFYNTSTPLFRLFLNKELDLKQQSVPDLRQHSVPEDDSHE